MSLRRVRLSEGQTLSSKSCVDEPIPTLPDSYGESTDRSNASPMYDRGNDGFGFIRLGGDANGIRQCGRVMELLNSREEPTIEQTVESLAQTVAHLALQLTIAQLQL